MITPSSSNDNLNEFDARVFIMIGQSLSVSEETEESICIIQSLKKSQEDYQKEYIQKLHQNIADFEAEKAEKTKELGIANYLQDRIDIHKKHGWMLRSIIKA